MLMANFIVAPFLLKSRNAVSVLFYNHVMLLGDCEGYFIGILFWYGTLCVMGVVQDVRGGSVTTGE